MPFKLREEPLVCLSCSIDPFSSRNGKTFATHLLSVHGQTLEDYTRLHFYGNVRPICRECGNETRFSKPDFKFMEYCIDHSQIPMRLGGRKGGRAPCPFKGKTKEDMPHLLQLSKALEKEGNPQFGKPHSEETKLKISISKRLGERTLIDRVSARADEFELVTQPHEYESRQKQYLDFKCVTCGLIQSKTLQAFERGSLCEKCFPIGTSIPECDLHEFIVSNCEHAVIKNDRTILKPKEIDVYIPALKLGFEHCGLYHHSDAAVVPKPKEYHLAKYTAARAVGVKLIQFWGDEWKHKRAICESMIRHRMRVSPRKISARDCAVTLVPWEEAEEFMQRTHISGSRAGKVYFALRHENEIVALLSLRTPRHKEKYKNAIEVGRFSTALDTNVRGALGKLIARAKDWALTAGYEKLMTYVDRRFGDGDGYAAVGFQLAGDSGISYDYTDFVCRYHRSICVSDGDSSEEEIARVNKMWRIYGCGSWIYVLDMKG